MEHVEGCKEDGGMSQQDPDEIQQMCESITPATEQLYALMQTTDWLESSSSEKDL